MNDLDHLRSLMPPWIGVKVDDAGGFLICHTVKDRSVYIDPIGMTSDELERAVNAAVTVLERTPVNRQQRRALKL